MDMLFIGYRAKVLIQTAAMT